MNVKLLNLYAVFLKKNLNQFRELRVVFDCSNGTSGPILNKIFAKNLFIKSKIINSEPNGNFPAHGPNPQKSDAIKNLQKEVIRFNADLGIIFDADADRMITIDNLGRKINPDIIAYLLIWNLEPKKIIIDALTGRLITKKQIKNCKIIKSKVGHYFIKSLMHKTSADLAIEYSGHYYFKKFYFCDSGILAAIEIINAVSKMPYQISDFINLVPVLYRSAEINIPLKNKKFLFKKIENFYKKQAKISHIDGLTIEFKKWWFNMRPSNTEPLIRLNIEADSKKLLGQKAAEIRRIISF